MGAFCVYGMTEQLAKKAAERAWQKYKESMTADVRACLRPSDQADWIKVKTEYHLAKGSPVQLSAPFDAPQFAREFIKLAAATGRTSRLCIMQRGPKLDKHGAPQISKATKRPMITWVPYPR